MTWSKLGVLRTFDYAKRKFGKDCVSYPRPKALLVDSRDIDNKVLIQLRSLVGDEACSSVETVLIHRLSLSPLYLNI